MFYLIHSIMEQLAQKYISPWIIKVFLFLKKPKTDVSLHGYSKGCHDLDKKIKNYARFVCTV